MSSLNQNNSNTGSEPVSQTSFFEQFSPNEIFNLWNSSTTLLELAEKLGFSDPNGLTCADYEYIEKLKNWDSWKTLVIGSNRKNGSDVCMLPI